MSLNNTTSGCATARTSFPSSLADLPTYQFGKSAGAPLENSAGIDSFVMGRLASANNDDGVSELEVRRLKLVSSATPIKLTPEQLEEAAVRAKIAALTPSRETPEDMAVRISEDYIKYSGVKSPQAYNIHTGEFMCKESFLDFILDSPKFGKVNIGTDDKPKLVSGGAPWWEWPIGCKFNAARIVMEPTSLPEYAERAAWEDTPRHGTYNRWHVLTSKRVKPDMSATLADIQIFVDHLMYTSGYEPVAVQHALCWLAHLYQYPQYKLRTAWHLYSQYNLTGKSFMIHLFKLVYGGTPLVDECEGSALGDKFTSLLEDGILRLFNELPADFDKRRFETIKTLISEKTRKSERKNHDAEIVNSYCNLIISTNNADALPFMEGDPRFNIFRCVESPRPPEYYKALFAWMTGPGPALFAGVMAQWVFPPEWDVKKGGAEAPQTAASAALQRESRDDLVNFIEGLIAGGEAPFDKDVGRPAALITQLKSTYPAVTGDMRLNFKTLAKALEKLRAVKIGSGNASKDKAWAWRYQHQWTVASLKDWQAYLDQNAPRPFQIEDSDHE